MTHSTRLRQSTLLRSTATVLLAGALCAGLGRAQALVWNAAPEYSSTQNPSGAWSYGWSLNRGAPLNPFNHSNMAYCAPMTGWSNQFPQYPLISKNETGSTVCCGSVRVPPNQIVLHPGQAGENAVVRWTAPDDGYYFVEVSFGGVDATFPTNSDAAVLHNLSTLFAAQISTFNGPPTCTSSSFTAAASFANVVQCVIGDTIDCNVGFGNNQRYNGDSTMVTARITRVTTAESVGSACGGQAQFATNLPFLGATVNLGLAQAANNSSGVLDIAYGPPQPALVLGCMLQPSLATQLGAIPLNTTPQGNWQGSLVMPVGNSWHGFQITWQALVLNPAGPQGFEFSNGWLLTL